MMSRFYILIILSATPLKWVGISPYSYMSLIALFFQVVDPAARRDHPA